MAARLLYCDIERENEGGERIPVAHNNYLRSVVSSRQSVACVARVWKRRERGFWARGKREPLAFLSHLKLPFPSLSNACHAGYRSAAKVILSVIRLTIGSTSEPLSSGIDVSQDNVFSELKNFGPWNLIPKILIFVRAGKKISHLEQEWTWFVF